MSNKTIKVALAGAGAQASLPAIVAMPSRGRKAPASSNMRRVLR